MFDFAIFVVSIVRKIVAGVAYVITIFALGPDKAETLFDLISGE